ncbi:MAG TPA: CHAD domain-containing protein [Candidatus Acidoferrales bacterium]|nr:CHAD domain-containing protein [Candidatus Acidoferrales bacterium]
MSTAAIPVAQTPPDKEARQDLRHWMKRVLRERSKARRDLDEDAIHDLRVALRRCRAVAEGLEQVDPDPSWKRMRKMAKRLLDSLSELRDIQVLQTTAAKVKIHRGRSRKLLREIWSTREDEAEKRVAEALDNFDVKQWKRWRRELPDRAARIPRDSPAVELLALEAWKNGWERHRFSQRSRSKLSLHKTRIGIKRFRYSVEDFLPSRYEKWSGELKELQDLLGDVHDLDVLWGEIARLRKKISNREREEWHAAIERKREPLLEKYHQLASGDHSRWSEWRASLPAGGELERTRVVFLAKWAAYLDPEPARARRLARLALQIFDGLRAAGLIGSDFHDSRGALEVAALVHGVGRTASGHIDPKETYKLIRHAVPPPGWSQDRMEVIARIARHYADGTSGAGGNWSRVSSRQSAEILLLAGILRLADALMKTDRKVARVRVGMENNAAIVRAAGFDSTGESAASVAAARSLLETELNRPVLVLPLGKSAA